jgi:hypothetical protein
VASELRGVQRTAYGDESPRSQADKPEGPADLADLEDLSFTTPPPSPSKTAEKITPTSIRQFAAMAAKTTPDRSFGPRERAAFEECLGSLEKCSDTPQRRERASQTHKVMKHVTNRAIAKLGLVGSIFPEAEGKGAPRHCFGLRDMDSFQGAWTETALHQLHTIYRDCQHLPDLPMISIVNLKHLLDADLRGKKQVGLHFFCKENAHLFSNIKELATNPITGVWCAECTLPASKAKVSTFFPKDITTVEALLSVLETSQHVMREENRVLLKVPGKKFLIEMYLRSEVVIWSAFPIFYHAEYQPDVTYQVTDKIKLTSAEVLELKKKGRVMYKTDDTEVVDIASALSGSPIPSGIYIFFKKTA